MKCCRVSKAVEEQRSGEKVSKPVWPLPARYMLWKHFPFIFVSFNQEEASCSNHHSASPQLNITYKYSLPFLKLSSRAQRCPPYPIRQFSLPFFNFNPAFPFTISSR